MDVHKPKPVHSWRELVSEIGIIVVGVLIALGAEQAVEQLHWSHQLAAARSEMRAEVQFDGADAYERLAAAPCLSQRLSRLHGELLSASGAWRGDRPDAASPGAGEPPPAYIAPWRRWSTEAYDAAVASGAASHMGSKEMAGWSSAYGLVKEMRAATAGEQQDVSQLADLSVDLPLSDAARQGFMRALADAKFDNLRAKALAREMLQALQVVGIDVPKSDRDDRLAGLRRSFGACTASPPYPPTDN